MAEGKCAVAAKFAGTERYFDQACAETGTLENVCDTGRSRSSMLCDGGLTDPPEFFFFFFFNPSASTTNYLYDGIEDTANVVQELDSAGNTLARFTQELAVDTPLSMLRSSVAIYFEQDGLGSVTSLSDSSCTLANTYSFGSFGWLISSTGAVNNSAQYAARETDSETGLHYNRARYYDPVTGRFLSEDVSRSETGVQAYRYAANNATNYVDWDGYSPKIPYPTFPKGTPKGYIGKFKNGWDEMLSALNRKDCRNFFCEHGASPDKVTNTLSNTEYLFEPLGDEDIGAQTNGPDSVFINSKGIFVTGSDGYITLGHQRFNLHDPSNVAALILLHELGHQLGFWGPDKGSPDNAAHSVDILRKCFTANSFPVH